MQLVNPHGTTSGGHLLPPMPNLFSSNDSQGMPEHLYTPSDAEDNQLTEDDRQCVDEIRGAQWQPRQLALAEQSDSRAESVLYEYHLSQPTTVSVDNTTLPTVRRSTNMKRKTNAGTRLTVQRQHKLPSPPVTTPHDDHHDILTTKQLFNTTATTRAAGTDTNNISHHKDRIAEAVELAVNNTSGRNEETGNSKVAEIRLVFDNSPPAQLQQHMGLHVGGNKMDHWNRPTLVTNSRPHTTDCTITGRPLLVRKPATRAGMRMMPENTGMLIM